MAKIGQKILGTWREDLSTFTLLKGVRNILLLDYSTKETHCYIFVNTLNTFEINHQPDATIFQFIILTFIYSSTCFGRFPAHHQKLNDCSDSLWFYLRIVVIVVLCSWSGPVCKVQNLIYCGLFLVLA